MNILATVMKCNECKQKSVIYFCTPFCSRKFTRHLRSFLPSHRRRTFILNYIVNHLRYFPFLFVYSQSNTHNSFFLLIYACCLSARATRTERFEKNRFSSHFIFSIIFFPYTSFAWDNVQRRSVISRVWPGEDAQIAARRERKSYRKKDQLIKLLEISS